MPAPSLERSCPRCGRAITARRVTARYCSGPCRQEMYRRRKWPNNGGPLTWDDLKALIPSVADLGVFVAADFAAPMSQDKHPKS
jgi:hypothetical protein